MQFWLCLICFLLGSLPVFAQQNTTQKDPTVALENFDFKGIDYASLDSVSRDYIKSIEHSLYHRFDAAEILRKKVSLRTDSPLSKVARQYLLNELYFWRGKYTDYVQFANQINEKNDKYDLAKALATHPVAKINFSVDSLQIPVTIRKHSYIIASVLLNGKPARLILDSGANLSIISQKLNDELHLATLATIDINNSVGTTSRGSVNLLDSLALGNVTVKNTPVICTRKSKLFKRQHVDGLLGWDILSKLTYTADFKAQTLTIRKPIADSTAEKNLFGIGLPLMIIPTTSEKQFNMFFDSGSNSVDLTEKGVTKLGQCSITRRPGMTAGIGKTRIGLFRYVKNFTFMIGHQSFARKATYISPVEWISLNIKSDGVISNAPF